jgi:hypothetical protein
MLLGLMSLALCRLYGSGCRRGRRLHLRVLGGLLGWVGLGLDGCFTFFHLGILFAVHEFESVAILLELLA